MNWIINTVYPLKKEAFTTEMKIFNWHGKELTVMREFEDQQYGTVWIAYLDDRKVYVVNGKIVENQDVIDDLDNKYGRPVSERYIAI